MLSEQEITIWACRIPSIVEEKEVNAALGKLPPIHQSYVESFKKWDDKLTRLTGRLLWQKFLVSNGLPLNSFNEPYFGTHGKPQSHEFGFNISHSADMVLVAFSGQISIGVDIERVRKVDIPSFTKQFSVNEIEAILSSAAPDEAFFEAWTRKESVVKALGKGLTKKLIELEPDAAGRFRVEHDIWHTQVVKVPQGYKAHLASSAPAVQSFQSLNFQELI